MTALTDISPTTRLCAVIGNPIGHSLSPAIHNAGYVKTGLDFVYVAFEVKDVAAALTGMRALDKFRGMSVTIPHKIAVMDLVDEIDDVDRQIGAINTVVREPGGRLVGLGTDGPGALKALTDAAVPMDGARVLFLGAGGAARAVAFTLVRDTTIGEISLLDVNQNLLDSLSADLSNFSKIPVKANRFDDAALASAMHTADIVIHGTPVGMHPNTDASLVPPELFHDGQCVFDIVYTPLETRLLADARARRLTTVSGVEMFINQAVLQFERFTGVDAPIPTMRSVVMEHLTR